MSKIAAAVIAAATLFVIAAAVGFNPAVVVLFAAGGFVSVVTAAPVPTPVLTVA